MASDAPEALTQPKLPDRPDVFVSYSRRDKAFVADRLVPELEARGKAVWVDVADIPPAADWRATMLDGVAKSAALLFVLSPDSVRSEVCAEELGHAVALGKRLVPVVARPVDPREAPAALQEVNWIGAEDPGSAFGLLFEALETDLEWREAHTRLTVRTTEWARAGRDASFLLRGRDLVQAEEWLAAQGAHAERATAEQTDYILRSRQAATRRARVTLAAVAFALAVAVVLAVVALAQRRQAVRQAHVAQSRELAATSLARAARDPELAVLLGLEATRRASTQQAEDALREALARWPERRALRAAGAQLAPDGRQLVVTGSEAVRVQDAASGRTLRSLPVPGGRVASARMSADGRAVAIAGAGGVTVADVASGRLIARTPGGDPASGAALDGTGTRVISWSATGARVHDARDGRPLATLDDPLTGGALLGPGGKLAVTYGPRRAASVWDVARERRVATLEHEQPLVGAALSPDGRLLVTAALGSTATVWRLPAGRRVATLRHTTAVNGAAFSRDGRRLLTIGSHGQVWDVARRRTIRTLAQDAQVLAGSFSPDGRRVVTGDVEGVARVWDVASGRLVSTLTGHSGAIDAVSVSADGRFVLTTGQDGTARIWEAAPGSSALPLHRPGAPAGAAGFGPDGRTLAVAGDDGVVRLHDGAGAPRGSLPGPRGAPTGLAFSQDGATLAVAGRQGEARVYDVGGRRMLSTLRGHRGAIAGVALSPDGRLASTTGRDATVRLWDARTGRALARLGPFGDIGATGTAFALGGRRVVAQVAEGVGLAKAPSGEEVAAFPDSFTATVAPDGATLAVGGTGGVTLRAAANGRELRRLTAPDGIFEAAFSRDGRLLAGASPSGGAYVWDVRSGDIRLRLRRPAVYSVAVDPSDRYAAAGYVNGGIGVFELGSEQRVASLGAGRPRTDAVAFGASPAALLAVERGGGAWLYACDVCRPLPGLVALARERVTRDFTPDERARFLHEPAP